MNPFDPTKINQSEAEAESESERSNLIAAAQPAIDVGPAMAKMKSQYPHYDVEIWVRAFGGRPNSLSFLAKVDLGEKAQFSNSYPSALTAVKDLIYKVGGPTPETMLAGKIADLKAQTADLEAELAQLRGLPEIKKEGA